MRNVKQGHCGSISDSLLFYGELTSSSQIPYIFLKLVLKVLFYLSYIVNMTFYEVFFSIFQIMIFGRRKAHYKEIDLI